MSANLAKIVALLNDGHYHDGTTLGQKLQITRSAVWKAIKKLENYGIQIDSIKGKGYALLVPLILLNKKKIEAGLAHQDLQLTILEKATSTNDYLKTLSLKKKATICLAEQQTQGKGRLSRSWHSPFAQNIYFSCAYQFQKDVSELAGLSLITSLAVLQTLIAYQVPDAILVKWPNDILYQNKKLCGNLIEIQAESNGTSQAILGIGININMLEDDSETITQAWTSLRKMTGNYIDRNQLCSSLINNLLDYLGRFEKFGLADFLQEWQDHDYLYNKEIAVKQHQKNIRGKALGINALGHLILETKEGLQYFSSGDTSILK